MTAAHEKSMRKLLVLLLLFVSVIAEGRKISESEAAAIASEFLNSATVKQSSAKTEVRRVKALGIANSDVAPFYIYNAEGNNGFVIVSGNDRANKILGYSDKGKFDCENMPAQLDALLKQYKRQITAMGENAEDGFSTVRDMTSRSSKVLPTAKFHQGWPFNLLTPIVNGVHAPTGCTATAMAIIMKYHNWPDREIGDYYFDFNFNEVAHDFSAEFDWDNILEDYSGTTNESQQLAIAKVMSEAGLAIGSNYSSKQTGAFTMTMSDILTRIFRFHPGLKYKEKARYDLIDGVMTQVKEYYTDEEWYNMIIYEIDNHRPVLYAATNFSASGGHSFVIDGYDDSNLFSINWGWGGTDNGFYALSALLPTDEYESAYPDQHEMWVGVMPEEHRPGQTSKLFFSGRENAGISFDAVTAKGNSFTIYLNGIVQRLRDIKGELGVKLKDDKGETVEIAAQTAPIKQFVDRFIISHVTFPIIADNWQLQAVYRETGSDWIEIPGCFGNDHCSTVQNAAKINFHIEEGVEVKILKPTAEFPDSYTVLVTPDSEGKIAPGRYLIQVDASHDDRVYHFEFDGTVQTDICCLVDIKPGSTHTVRAYSILHSALENVAVTTDEAGTLSSALAAHEPNSLGSLKISGPINSSDFYWICANYPNLYTLDASHAYYERVSGGGYGYHERVSLLNNSLQTLMLPSNISKIWYVDIGNVAFLKTLHIPASVTVMSEKAVETSRLSDVYIYNPVPPLREQYDDNPSAPTQIFSQYPSDFTIHVPRGSKRAYEQSEDWNIYGQIVEFDAQSGIDEVISDDADSENCDIFNMQGVCLKRQASATDVDHLLPGMYILRYNNTIKKLIIR